MGVIIIQYLSFQQPVPNKRDMATGCLHFPVLSRLIEGKGCQRDDQAR